MKYIRIGNNVSIIWEILRYNLEEDFTNKKVGVYLIDKNKHRNYFDYHIEGNKIIGTFLGKDQTCIGTYRLCLIENDGEDDMVMLDYIDAFVLTQKLKNVTSQGEDVASNLTTEAVAISSNILTGDLGKIATKDYVQDVLEKAVNGEVNLEAYAKKEDIPDVSKFITELPNNLVTESELENKGYLTEHQSLKGYAKTVDVESKFLPKATAATKEEVKAVENKIPSIKGLASESYVDSAIQSAQLSGEGNEVDLSAYLKSADADKIYQPIGNYLTQHQDISGKQDVIEDLDIIRANAKLGKTALQSIPSEYITEDELTDKGYLTEHQSLKGYATEDYVTTAIKNSFWEGTQAEYDALTAKDDNIIYLIKEE